MSNVNPHQQPGWGQPGQPYYGQPPLPPQKKSKGKVFALGCSGAIAVLVVIGIGAAIAGGGKDSGAKSSGSKDSNAPLTSSNNNGHPPAGDIKLTSCAVDSTLDFPTAKVDITNHTSKASDYSIQVEFIDAKGNRLAAGYALENALAPGQKSTQTAMGDNEVHGKFTCKVAKVDRYASTG